MTDFKAVLSIVAHQENILEICHELGEIKKISVNIILLNRILYSYDRVIIILSNENMTNTTRL